MMSSTAEPEHPEQQNHEAKKLKKPRHKSKLAEAEDYVPLSSEEDLSELVLVKTEKSSGDTNSSTNVSYNKTKVYYRCRTCSRLVTTMGNRKTKLRLHLRSKYHRLRAKAAADALDADLVRIVANLHANNVKCLEIRERSGGSVTENTSKIQLYCNFCEAELVTRKSSNIRRHLESKAHKRSAQLNAEYEPMDSTTFHFELVQWLVDCELSVDRLQVMRPFLERHCRRRILEPATLKRDFLPYVLAAGNGENRTLEQKEQELPKGSMKKRAAEWLRRRNELKAKQAEKEQKEEAAKILKARAKRMKRKLVVVEEEAEKIEEVSVTSSSTLITTSTLTKSNHILKVNGGVGGDGPVGEDSSAVMAILEEGVDYEVVHLEEVGDGTHRALIQERLPGDPAIEQHQPNQSISFQSLPPISLAPSVPLVSKPKYRPATAGVSAPKKAKIGV